MALFKSKNNRRSSSSSYSSTVTTFVFIALCVLGIWMLTSNSAISPLKQTSETITTYAALGNTATNNFLSSSEDSAETAPKIIQDSVETISKSSEESAETTTKIQDQKDTTVYPDNPGQLPDDAIQSDDKNPNVNSNNEPQKEHSSNSDSTQISEESSLTQKQAASETYEATSDNDQEASFRAHESEKVQRGSTETSEGNHEEENPKAQDENSDTKSKQNREPENVNAIENQEQITGRLREDVQSSDTQESKNDDEINKQSIEDKGEITEKDRKQQSQELREVQHKNEENSDSDTHNALDASQQESHADPTGESSQLSQADLEQKENQKIQDENQETQQQKTEKKKKKQKAADKGYLRSKSSKPLPKESEKKDKSNEKEGQKDESNGTEKVQGYTWYLCDVTAGADYIPCLDNEKVVNKLHSRKHFEHRERHCPDDAPTCLVPLPKGYKRSIEWPSSRDKIWYHNVPHTKLAEVKGHQNWVKVSGEFLTFPGGGTQFIHGALHYIDFIQQTEPSIAWGKRTRVILDVGCGVGSFGGYLFERDVLTMSFAPKDEHEAQVQFALERGIPAISAVMGSQRLQFPGRVFDLVHCARCRVPWHADGGLLLLELNRVLRPGGYFVWSATPVYQKLEEDVQIWKEMSSLTKSMCWELVTINKDILDQVGAAVYRKPTSNKCYDEREQKQPPMCKDDDDPNAAWYIPLQACMHKVPVDEAERGARWPEAWPRRLHTPPYWLNNSQTGIYGKPASQDFAADNERWKNVVDEMSNIGITWSNVRNIMDMRAVYGGFAAALRELPVWVFNVVNVDSPDTLPIIYERGLFGIYHDWCESFSTYPRTYDLLHADNLFSKLKNRCNLVPVMAEVDRIVRPEGKLIVRDEASTIDDVETLLKSQHWEVTKKQEGMLCAKKGNWRPHLL